jgi:uncharacterized protein (DUF2147 family)
MRLSPLVFCAMIVGDASSLAAEAPIGEWLAADRYVKVRIENCGGVLWGVVSGELRPGQDVHNPDPALRDRLVLGIPMLLDMKENVSAIMGDQITRWEGHIYSSQDGKTYESKIRLVSPHMMKVETCEFGGIFCGAQHWGRVQARSADTTVQKSNAPKAKMPAPMPATPRSIIAAGDVCSRVVSGPGQTR